MIQRIQSLYLLLTTLLALIFLNGSFLEFFNISSDVIILNYNGLWLSGEKAVQEAGLSPIILSTLIIIIALTALAAIFLYRNRKIQMKLTLVLIIFDIILILLLAYYAYWVIRKHQADFMVTLNMVIPALLLIFSILAHTAIHKDEKLVRSYDRLR